MKRLCWLLPALLLPATIVRYDADAQQVKAGKSPKILWKRIVIDAEFRSEGAGVADVNKDGKPDIIVGDCWYEAPKDPAGKWTRHVLRADRKFNPLNYSDSFCCFPDDFNGDGWTDVIVIPFPGNPCYWYENPGAKGGMWKEHLLTNSACNETPIYVDLFKIGKKVLLMGWNPQKDASDLKKGNYDDRGEMCYFLPGKDPTRPWARHSISGPSTPGKFMVPGTQRFAHGLGAGDVNKDGRLDVICTGGWWEQPEKNGSAHWKFHPANLGPACADMHALDIDGDGHNDIVSSSAHAYGLWWHQQKPGKGSPDFLTRELLPFPATLAKQAADRKFLGKEENDLYGAINRLRDKHFRKAALVADPELSRMARDHAERSLKAKPGADVNIGGKYKGKIVNVVMIGDPAGSADALARTILDKAEQGLLQPGFQIGIGYAQGEGNARRYTLIIGDRGLFSLPAATHAMHHIDIDGDGLKDLVTGRRYWAHAPNPKGGGGDAGVNDPAFLYWLQARRARDGSVSFTPHLIDDDSGVGTSFAIHDMNGDGLLDIVIANKRGVFVFLQVRTKE